MGKVCLAQTWLRVALVAMALCAACASVAGPKVYVDTKGIDDRKDLTDTQKKEVKDAMKQTIKENLEQAFGAGNVTVTDDASQKATADRTVTTENTVGSETSGGKTTYHWGDWEHGSSNTTVHVGTYMDDPPGVSGDFKKPDGSWDTKELGTAMGTTASHEVAHSYSAGHDDTNTNKMNTANSAGDLDGGLNFNDPPKTTLKNNNGKPPCTTTTDYKSTCCIADWWSDPNYPLDFLLHESLSISTSFGFGGPLAPMFDFGWWGIDTDNGIHDGNSWGDFVYKSSMTATPMDASKITFFDGWTAHFVLRGKVDTPYSGRYFDVPPADIMLSNWTVRPDGTMVARHIDLRWEIDGMIGPDVMVAMDTNCYGPDSPEFSGFNLGIAPPISIPEAKQRVDGAMVSLAGKVVTAVLADRIYIEEPTRASGVRCNWVGPVVPSQAVHVIGKMSTTIDGERVVEAQELLPTGLAEVRPLGMTNKSVGGSDFHYIAGLWPSGQQGVMDGVGLNNIGLSVRVFGRVMAVEPSAMPSWFVIDDGSQVMLKILYGPGPLYPAPHMYVTVDGIATCEREPGLLEKPIRAVRATGWQPVPEVGIPD